MSPMMSSVIPRFWKRDVPRRKRALTMPLSEPAMILWRRQKTVGQTMSILLGKLPLEVRELIYTYSLVYPCQHWSIQAEGNDAIHIFLLYPKVLVHRRCRTACGQCTSRCYGKFVDRWGSKNLSALLLTCRQM